MKAIEKAKCHWNWKKYKVYEMFQKTTKVILKANFNNSSFVISLSFVCIAIASSKTKAKEKYLYLRMFLYFILFYKKFNMSVKTCYTYNIYITYASCAAVWRIWQMIFMQLFNHFINYFLNGFNVEELKNILLRKSDFRKLGYKFNYATLCTKLINM